MPFGKIVNEKQQATTSLDATAFTHGYIQTKNDVFPTPYNLFIIFANNVLSRILGASSFLHLHLCLRGTGMNHIWAIS